jgi:hypothetical protein
MDIGGAYSIIEVGNVFTIPRECLKERDELGDLEIDVRTILKSIFENRL